MRMAIAQARDDHAGNRRGAQRAQSMPTMRYDPEATTVDTPMAEAFAARHGVCQDFTHM
jgi:transglutaminase-like putative cysteine protease